MTEVLPILQQHLDAVGSFLHENLARRILPSTWAGSLTHPWAAAQPNFGMQLRDGDRLVGVLCAVYSDQLIDGKVEKFCNPHSWCVQDEYRHASIGLVLAVLKQRGYHFTMFTPNPKVAQVFLGLRFRVLDDRLLYVANLPAPWARGADNFVETAPERIAARLAGTALMDFEAHRTIPWLNFVVFGNSVDTCLVIYKRSRWKKMATALISHISDSAALDRHGHLLRHHLLSCGMPVARVEARFLSTIPLLAYRTRRSQPKLVLSKTLDDSKVRDVYSELMALNI